MPNSQYWADAYLEKRDIDVARVLKQITKSEVQELLETLNKCNKKRKVENIVLDNVV